MDVSPDASSWPDLAEARDVAIRAAEIAAGVQRSTPLGAVRTKAHAADAVTDVDTATELAVREHLSRAYPDHVVVGEELGGQASSGPTWYCDPVDGTTNLASGLPWTSFSLSLAVGRTALVGLVMDPWRGELLHAARGGGAFRRDLGGTHDEPLHVADVARLAGAVVMTEWAAHIAWPGMLRLLTGLSDAMCTSRIMGSGTLSVAAVGAGRAAGAVIGEFHAEDHLAALLICIEAGAVVRDAAGKRSAWPAEGPFVVAAPGVARELVALVG